MGSSRSRAPVSDRRDPRGSGRESNAIRNPFQGWPWPHASSPYFFPLLSRPRALRGDRRPAGRADRPRRGGAVDRRRGAARARPGALAGAARRDGRLAAAAPRGGARRPRPGGAARRLPGTRRSGCAATPRTTTIPATACSTRSSRADWGSRSLSRWSTWRSAAGSDVPLHGVGFPGHFLLRHCAHGPGSSSTPSTAAGRSPRRTAARCSSG